MHNLITIFERQAVAYQAVGLKVDDPFLATLEHLNITSGRELIRLERNKLRATQFVGVIQTGNTTIQILPKIDYDPNSDTEALIGSAAYERATTSAAQNFLQLLVHARRVKLHNQSLAALNTHRGAWLEMLTRLFAVELLIQLQQGFHQDYVLQEDLLPYVRGRWNIGRQFSRQPNLHQGLDVSYHDYLPDTVLNRIFRLAINKLQYVTRDTQNRQMLADLESWFQPVKLTDAFHPADLGQIHFSRLNERFFSAFQLAQLLLQGLTVQLLVGGQRAIAFVFDMDLLFQEYVAGFLQAYRERILPEDWRHLRIELQGGAIKKHLVKPSSPAEKPMFLLEPDILIGLPGLPALIIDTKNKSLPPKQLYRAVAEGDAYQMLAYATEFCCPSVLLIYPHTAGAEIFPPKMMMMQQTSIRLFIATLNLHQPLDKVSPMIQEFRNVLSSIFTQINAPSEVSWPS